MTSRSWRAKAAATLCSVTLVLAACGGDDDGDDTSPATSPTESTGTAGSATGGESSGTAATDDSATDDSATDGTASTGTATDGTAGTGTAGTGEGAAEQTGEAAGTPIKVALLYSETGRSASSYLTSDDVADAWVEHANATKNGANGHPIELFAYDVESDVSVAAEKAREAVEVEGVAAVIIQDSNTEIAVRPYLAGKGVPVIGGSSNAFVDAPGSEFVMSTTPPASYAGQVAAAQAVGATMFSAMVCSEVPSCADAAPFYEQHVESSFGLGYVPLITASHTEPSYTAQCLGLVDKGADYMVLAFAAAVIEIIAQECMLQGFDGYFGLSGNSIVGDMAETATYPLVGYLNGFPWWADDPAVEEFRTVTAEAAPDADVRNPAATITWATLELLRKAMIDHGPAADAEVGPAELIDTYTQVSGESLGGLLPMPVTFSAGDASQPTVDCAYLVKVEDGEFVTIAEGESGNGASGDLQSWCWEG